MLRHFLFLLLVFFSFSLYAQRHSRRDTTFIYKKVDTTYIQSYRDRLNMKLVLGARTNSFAVTNKLSKESIEYAINSKVNFGIGISYKWLGLEIQFSPKALNQNDEKFGKSTQFSLAASGNSRKFIYDVFYRYHKGYHTTAMYTFEPDTVPSYYKRADITNNNLGINIIYVFNNKRFSSAAPYNQTARQRRSAGSFLMGTYMFAYTIDADTIIFPDTLYTSYKRELQFKSAGSYTWGLSIGYTYTFVFFKNWYFNIATIPGISLQEFYSVNAFDKTAFNRSSASLSLQSKFALGYGRKNFFIGMSLTNNNFLISDDKESTMNYKYGAFRIFYGYRFDLAKKSKKKAGN
jgi:hypothetical protein